MIAIFASFDEAYFNVVLQHFIWQILAKTRGEVLLWPASHTHVDEGSPWSGPEAVVPIAWRCRAHEHSVADLLTQHHCSVRWSPTNDYFIIFVLLFVSRISPRSDATELIEMLLHFYCAWQIEAGKVRIFRQDTWNMGSDGCFIWNF